MNKLEKINLPEFAKLNPTDGFFVLAEKLNEIVDRVNIIAPPGNVYPEDFNNFYNLYPRKAQKKEAYRAWVAMKDNIPPWEDLEQFVKNYAKSVSDRETKYIPHASTWLNREGWTEDEAQRVRPRHPVMTPVAEMGSLCPNPELMIAQQAPDWSHHGKWQDYVMAINNGKTALEFEEWLEGVKAMRGLFDDQ